MNTKLFMYIYSLRDMLILSSLIDCIKCILSGTTINTVCLVLIVLGLYGLKTYNKSYLFTYSIYILYILVSLFIQMFYSFDILSIGLLVYYLWIMYNIQLLYNVLYETHEEDVKEIIKFS
jgi:hypothetical protein